MPKRGSGGPKMVKKSNWGPLPHGYHVSAASAVSGRVACADWSVKADWAADQPTSSRHVALTATRPLTRLLTWR